MNAYDQDLERNPANYAPLTPLGFIERAAYVYPERTAVVHGARRYTWGETYARSRRLASALAGRVASAGHRGSDGIEHAGDVRMPFRRADDGRGAEHAQHPPRCESDRVHAEPRCGESADRRPGVFGDRGASTGADGQARS